MNIRRCIYAVLLAVSLVIVIPPRSASAQFLDFFAGADEKKAYELFRGAENGSEKSMTKLRELANSGNRWAALQYGYLYHVGRAPRHGDRAGGKDIQIAMRAYELAAGKTTDEEKLTGNPLAAYNLGLIYLWGQNTGTPNSKDATRWFTAAAGDRDGGGRNFLPAAMQLANIYEQGFLDVPKNPQLSTRWYRVAASMREPVAQFKLGRALIEGIGIDRNNFEGMNSLRNAADKWNRQAMYYMAGIYANGNDYQEQNLFEAAKWLVIAATGDPRYRKAADSMLANLSQKDQQRVAQNAKIWVSGHQRVPERIEYNAPLNVEPRPIPGAK